MTSGPEISAEFLGTIAECHTRLSSFAGSLRSSPLARTVTHWLDISGAREGYQIEEFVDTELTGGKALSMCLLIRGDPDGWTVEAEVRLLHGHGQDTIESIGCDRTSSLERCKELLRSFTSTITGKVDLLGQYG